MESMRSMLRPGPALRVVIHLNADIPSRDDYLHNQLLAFLHDHKVAGATVFRPYAGFGLHQRVHRKDAPGSEGEHLPIRIDFVEEKSRVDALLPELLEMVTDGMVEIQETNVLKVAGKATHSDSADGPTG
jgi:uncharacterized protein